MSSCLRADCVKLLCCELVLLFPIFYLILWYLHIFKHAESLCKHVKPRPSVFNGPEVTMPPNSEDLHGCPRCATKRNSFHRRQGHEIICTSAVKMTTRPREFERLPTTFVDVGDSVLCRFCSQKTYRPIGF